MLDQRLVLDLDRLQRGVEDDVQCFIDELEATLDSRERRLLHQLRLAAETLGAVRARISLPTRRR